MRRRFSIAKKKKKKSLTSLKRKAWALFSEWIRRKDADHRGFNKCCTCGKEEHYSNQDAGHFISRVYLATFFEETNVHVQCRADNRFRNGSPDEYAKFIIDTYGIEELERLRLLKYESVKYTIADYEERIIDLKEKLESLNG